MTRILVAMAAGVEAVGGEGAALPGLPVTTLSPDGRWAVASGRELWHDGDRGWARVATTPGPALRCVAETGGVAFAGTAEAHLVRLEGTHLAPVPGFDGAEGREAWYTPWGGPPDTRSLAVADAIYANVHVGGILRSDDGGDSWRPTIDIHADVHQVVAPPERPGVVLAACARGLAVSEDGGTSWRYDADGLHAPYARAAAVAGDTVLLTASTGPSGRRAAVYRRPLAEGGFQRCGGGLPDWFEGNIDTYCLSARGTSAAFVTPDGDVFVSDDAGVGWERAAAGLPQARALVVLD